MVRNMVTEDMVRKMDERRKWKNKNNEEGKKRYRQLNNELKGEAIKAKGRGGAKNVINWKNLTQEEGLT